MKAANIVTKARNRAEYQYESSGTVMREGMSPELDLNAIYYGVWEHLSTEEVTAITLQMTTNNFVTLSVEWKVGERSVISTQISVEEAILTVLEGVGA